MLGSPSSSATDYDNGEEPVMQKEDARSEADSRSDSSPVDSILEILIDYLDAKRTSMVEEIRAYPSPIPACDAQFNYLLEQRTKQSHELERLHRIHKGVLQGESGMMRIREFIESSDCIHSDMKRQMMKACGRHDSNEREWCGYIRKLIENS